MTMHDHAMNFFAPRCATWAFQRLAAMARPLTIWMPHTRTLNSALPGLVLRDVWHP